MDKIKKPNINELKFETLLSNKAKVIKDKKLINNEKYLEV
tara:strand:+ start:909 stop:1028 length:120 start_codon:yes stop_codon:yes gene_type:complete